MNILSRNINIYEYLKQNWNGYFALVRPNSMYRRIGILNIEIKNIPLPYPFKFTDKETMTFISQDCGPVVPVQRSNQLSYRVQL